MREYAIKPNYTKSPETKVWLDPDVPDTWARIFWAILNTQHLEIANKFKVNRIVVGAGVLEGTPKAIGHYDDWDNGGRITIDIDRLIHAVIRTGTGDFELRHYAFYSLGHVFSHEAIHAKNAAMWPEEFGYIKGLTPDRQERAEMADEEVARKEDSQLWHMALDTFAIEAENLQWLENHLVHAIKQTGVVDSKMMGIHNNWVYSDSNSITTDNWRAFLYHNNLAQSKVEDLLPLPHLAEEKETAVSQSFSIPNVMDAVVDTPAQTPVQNDTPETPVVNEQPEVQSQASTPGTYVDENGLEIDMGVVSGEESDTPENFQVPDFNPDANPIKQPGTVPPAQPTAPQQPEVQPQAPAQPSSDIRAYEQALSKMFDDLLLRIFNHIYTKCGYDGYGSFQEGIRENGVAEKIYVGDIPMVKETLTEFHYFNEHRQFCKHTGGDVEWIAGVISSQAKVPMYHLVFNVMGQTAVRRVVAQNPNKTNSNGEWSWPAKAVRGLLPGQTGPEAICWVIDPNAPANSRFKYKINNGNITRIN